MKQKQLYFFIGTNAELIKLAPLINELRKRRSKYKIISAGQNDLAIEELEILFGKQKIDIALKKRKNKSSLLLFFFWTSKSFFQALWELRHEFSNIDRRTSFFIVHGDTVSSLLGSIIAKIYNIKIAHIESGLRSFNFLEPFPEEICRVIISRMATIHFCPNNWAINNLNSVSGIKINTNHNTVVESLLIALKTKPSTTVVKRLTKQSYFLFVLHRQEHTLFQQAEAKKVVKLISKHTTKNLKCAIVLHKLTENFLIQQNLMSKLQENKNVIFIPRMPYTEFIHVMNNAKFFVTDGGSNQEEAYYLGKPCLIIRNHTERIEGLNSNAVLSGHSSKVINNFFKNYRSLKAKPIKIKVRPSKIIADYLTQKYA